MKRLCARAVPVSLGVLLALTGCAVKPVPDPRNPAMVRDGPVVLRVCYVDGDGAHLAVGDQVELSTNRLGRLRIRHIADSQNQQALWNGGDDVRVKSAVLVELDEQRANRVAARRFVPVGRFRVRLAGTDGHARFDFLTSKATENLSDNPYPECNVDLGDDELIIRGVEDMDRHGGIAHLR